MMTDISPESLEYRYNTFLEGRRELAGQRKIRLVEWSFYDRSAGEREKPWAYLAVKITAGDGLFGVCQLPAWHKAPCQRKFRDTASELLIHCDPFDIDAIRLKLRDYDIPDILIAYIDTALWDMHGRLENKAVHSLIGKVRDRIRPYHSTLFNVGSPEDYAADALKVRAQGFAGYKIHPNRDWNGPHDIEQEIAIYRAVREAVTDDWPLMADPFIVHEYNDARRLGKILDELDYYWYESPMPESDEYIAQYAHLRKEVNLPLIGGETSPGAHEKRIEWLDAGATDWGRLDIFNGGLTSCFLLAIECEKRGIPMDLHCAMHPHAQVFGATTEELIPFVEGYGVPLSGPLDHEGMMRIPDEVGVGNAPDEEVIRAHPMDWEIVEQ